jgi:hypothetical protein
MPDSETARLLAETRRVLGEAKELAGRGDGASADGDGNGPEASVSGILDLYERLRRSLDAVDGDRLKELLSRISEHVEQLNALGTDLEYVRRLQTGLRDG